MTLADGKLSSQNLPWRQIPHFFPQTSQIKNYLNVIHRITGTMRRCILVKGYSERERGTWIHGVYKLGRVCVKMGCFAAGVPSHFGTVRRLGIVSAESAAWSPVWRQVVTSGCDVRLWRPQERPSWDGRGITLIKNNVNSSYDLGSLIGYQSRLFHVPAHTTDEIIRVAWIFYWTSFNILHSQALI